MKIKFYVFCIFLWACNSGGDKNKDAGRDSAGARTDSPAAIRPAGEKTAAGDSTAGKSGKSDSAGGYIFTYKNDSLAQTMSLTYKDKKQKTMAFTLIVTDTRNNVSDTVKGVLEKQPPEGDSESDNADNGAYFFYDNWNYTHGKCQLNFRIDKDDVKYIRIQEFYCEKLRKPGCPFETKGVLKRIDVQ